MSDSPQVIAATRSWVEKVIVGLNFCPFAKKELVQNTIRFVVSPATQLESALQVLAEEWQFLDEQGETETTLLIFDAGFAEFDAFLQLIDYANMLLQMQGYEGTYQLAHFHPDYCFDGAEVTDAANYTNRSPYPTLHIIREKSMAEVLSSFPNPDAIPERNVGLARSKGLVQMQALLDECVKAGQ